MQVSIPADSTAAAEQARTQNLKKAASACFIGNFVEWFDYAAYGYLAPSSRWFSFPAKTLW